MMVKMEILCSESFVLIRTAQNDDSFKDFMIFFFYEFYHFLPFVREGAQYFVKD